MQNFRGKKRPANSIINLKLFTDSFSNPTKSPRKNFQNGVVGLGIVVAMTDDNSTTHAHHQSICFAPSPRSTTPIPIKPYSVISLFGDDDDKDCSVFNMGRFKRDDFLTNCHLCKKELHGLDIFMYRGEKAFCSAECRDKQITSDDHKQTCGAEAKKGKPLDCSESALDCSSLQVLFAVVSAA